MASRRYVQPCHSPRHIRNTVPSTNQSWVMVGRLAIHFSCYLAVEVETKVGATSSESSACANANSRGSANQRGSYFSLETIASRKCANNANARRRVKSCNGSSSRLTNDKSQSRAALNSPGNFLMALARGDIGDWSLLLLLLLLLPLQLFSAPRLQFITDRSAVFVGHVFAAQGLRASHSINEPVKSCCCCHGCRWLQTANSLQSISWWPTCA